MFVLAALCALALALGVTALAPAPERAFAAEEHTNHDGWTPLTAEGSTLTDGNYYLDQNITLTNDLTFSGTVTLCLNGYKLTGTGSGSVITVNYGANFTLCDCNGSHGEHRYFIAQDGAYNFDDSGDRMIQGGVITGGNNTTEVAGFGTINGNIAGGVWAEGTFTMTGGTIAGNRAYGSAGVDIGRGGLVEITGEVDGTFRMQGGSIEGNYATSNTGGVGVGANSKFILEGGSIRNNVSQSNGGVNVGVGGEFQMLGGSIEENQANSLGGGVNVSTLGYFEMRRGSISGNSATKNSDAVYAHGGDITIYGGEIDGNMYKPGSGTVEIAGGVFPGKDFVKDYEQNTVEYIFADNVTITSLSDGRIAATSSESSQYLVLYYHGGEQAGYDLLSVGEELVIPTAEELQINVEAGKLFGWSLEEDGEIVYEGGQITSELSDTAGNIITLYAVQVRDVAADVDNIISELEAAVAKVNEAIGDGSAANLQEALNALINAYEAADETLASADEALKTAIETAYKAAVQEASEALKTAYEAADANLQAQIDALEEQIGKDVAQEVSALTQQIEALDEAYKAADALLASDIAGLEGNVGELNEADEALKAAIDALDAAYKAADEAILEAVEELRAENAAQSAELERQDGELERQDAELERQSAELERQDAELNTLSVVLYISLAVAVVALGVGTAGLVFGLKAKKKD